MLQRLGSVKGFGSAVLKLLLLLDNFLLDSVQRAYSKIEPAGVTVFMLQKWVRIVMVLIVIALVPFLSFPGSSRFPILFLLVLFCVFLPLVEIQTVEERKSKFLETRHLDDWPVGAGERLFWIAAVFLIAPVPHDSVWLLFDILAGCFILRMYIDECVPQQQGSVPGR